MSEESAPNVEDRIRKEVERIHESALYSSETQFEYSKRWRRVDRLIGTCSAALAAAAGIGGLSEVLSRRGAGAVAILSALAGAVAASLGAPQVKKRAAQMANAYRSLQQDARIFLNIDRYGTSSEKARSTLEELKARLQELNQTADLPSERSRKIAKDNIEKRGAQDYSVDNE